MPIELLAPARDFVCGKAAIDSGADAVYIAGPAFGAREAAGNPLTEVARLVRYGRPFGVKTYLALNTLLYPNEVTTARQIAIQAWEAGCAALVIQDPQLLEAGLPPIPLIASTQMNNRTVEQVQRLERLGFERVILARELSLKQIAEIRAHTSVALEFFVHGALCVSFSGRCFLSEHLTGRSANRGVCIQACRNRYHLIDATGRAIVRDKHLLSLRDLCLDRHLEGLMAAGITSFKIEGRLKNSAYVKNVVAHYRKLLDSIGGCRPSSLGCVGRSFEPHPRHTFSRGHTTYNISDRRSGWATMIHGKAMGEEIGSIAASEKRYVATLHPHVVLHVGDGVCFMNPQGVWVGSTVNAVTPASVANQFLIELQAGSSIGAHNTLYRTYNHLFEKALAHPRSVKRTIDVEVEVIIEQEGVTLRAHIPHGTSVSLRLPCNGSPAKDLEQVNKQIHKQLEKSAEPCYLFRVASLQNRSALFFPAAQINEWRRRLGAALLEATPMPSDIVHPLPSLDKQALRELKQHIPPVGVIPDTLMQCKYCIKYELGLCEKERRHEAPPKLPSEPLHEPLYLVNQGKKFKILFDCERCEMRVEREQTSSH